MNTVMGTEKKSSNFTSSKRVQFFFRGIFVFLLVFHISGVGLAFGSSGGKKAILDPIPVESKKEAAVPEPQLLADAPGLLDAKGEAFSFTPMKEKIVIVEFYSYQCPYMKKKAYNRKHSAGESLNVPSIQAWRKTQDKLKDAIWVSVLVGKKPSDFKAAKEYTLDGALPDHFIFDSQGNFGKLLGAKTTPHYFVYDKGLLVYEGALDDKPSTKVSSFEGSKPYLKNALEALANGEKPKVAQSNPYGCSVKYPK